MYKVSNNDIINALDNAIASVEMEGFVFSDGERGLCRSVLEGKITKDDFIRLLLEKCKI